MSPSASVTPGSAPSGLVTAEKTAVLLCSSDNTFDVGVQIAAAFDRHWADCPYPRFVLTTSAAQQWPHSAWTRLTAGSPQGWREELRLGVRKLPSPVRHILLMLDDFLLLAPVESRRAQELIGEAERLDLAYLRLTPVHRSLAAGLLRRLVARSPVIALPDGEPYYSSLQMAVWRREHLVALLARPGSIWQFEHQRAAAARHYAVTRPGPIKYVHVVERGKWGANAAAAFQKAGVPFNPGDRPSWGRRYGLNQRFKTIRFALLGYSAMRLKAWLRVCIKKVTAR